MSDFDIDDDFYPYTEFKHDLQKDALKKVATIVVKESCVLGVTRALADYFLEHDECPVWEHLDLGETHALAFCIRDDLLYKEWGELMDAKKIISEGNDEQD